MSAADTLGGVLQRDHAGSLPRHKPEGPDNASFGSMPVFLYVFTALIVVFHALAFAAWLFFFLKDLAVNRTASVKTHSVKPSLEKKLHPDTLSGKPITGIKEGSQTALSSESLRLRKPVVSNSAGSSSFLPGDDHRPQRCLVSSGNSHDKARTE